MCVCVYIYIYIVCVCACAYTVYVCAYTVCMCAYINATLRGPRTRCAPHFSGHARAFSNAAAPSISRRHTPKA